MGISFISRTVFFLVFINGKKEPKDVTKNYFLLIMLFHKLSKKTQNIWFYRFFFVIFVKLSATLRNNSIYLNE